MDYLNIFIKSIFVDNMIFAFFLGMCSYLLAATTDGHQHNLHLPKRLDAYANNFTSTAVKTQYQECFYVYRRKTTTCHDSKE